MLLYLTECYNTLLALLTFALFYDCFGYREMVDTVKTDEVLEMGDFVTVLPGSQCN